MKLILEMPSGKVIELDEIPVKITFSGPKDGHPFKPVVFDVFSPLVLETENWEPALTINNKNPEYLAAQDEFGMPKLTGFMDGILVLPAPGSGRKVAGNALEPAVLPEPDCVSMSE